MKTWKSLYTIWDLRIHFHPALMKIPSLSWFGKPSLQSFDGYVGIAACASPLYS